MLRGETTTRSDLDADRIMATLQTAGAARLRDAGELWVILDGSDLRKPYAETMPHLQRVTRLDGAGTVAGYATLNAIGLGPAGERGLLYHHLFSSQAPDFVSEPAEVTTALRSVGAALAPRGTDVTVILDRGFDDVAVWRALWTQRFHLLCRVKHRDRLVRPAPDRPLVALATCAVRLRTLAQLETTLVVRKPGQARPKRQPVTATIRAVPVVVPDHPATWQLGEEPVVEHACWLVEVRLERVTSDPWWLLTDRPVETADQAVEVFRMYRERWAIEDAFKVTKQCLGWEDVQLLDFDSIRLLIALGWVAAGFLFELGVTLDWAALRLLRRLGGGEDRPNRPPGKLVLTRGLRRLVDFLALAALLADEQQRHGVPPPIAALLRQLQLE